MKDAKGPMRVLFLCTGNSCRSQMAEGFARALDRGGVGGSGDSGAGGGVAAGGVAAGGDGRNTHWEVASAGLEPAGLNPRAVQVMAEVGVDISGHTSKLLDPAILPDLDLVVTLCGDADEHCPVLPPGVRKVHWPLPDPARAKGTEDEVLAVFRRVRDDIAARVTALFKELTADQGTSVTHLEGMTVPAVHRTIQIDARPRTVWELMSTQESLRNWFQRDIEIEMRVGGQFRFPVPEFDMHISGYVLEMEPEKSLVLSWFEEGGDWKFPIRSNFTLEAVSGGTLVTHRYDGFAGIGKTAWDRTLDNYNRGADRHQLLAKLKEAAEGRAPDGVATEVVLE